MADILKRRRLPTPFGDIHLPAIETPPLARPRTPDAHARKAIKQGLGWDLADVIALLPAVGVVADSVRDLHNAEIKDLLTAEEYTKFAEYSKWLPISLALARVFCFKK